MAVRPQVSGQGGLARTVGSFVAGVVVGALMVWGWNGIGGSNTVATPTKNATTTDSMGGATMTTGGSAIAGGTTTVAPVVTNTNDIEVGSQDAGTQVLVTDATVNVPTWIVVYELAQGKPVRALGAAMFFPQYNGKGGIIPLARATQPHTTYFVGQSLDSGDHSFTLHVNKEVLDSSGKMIGTTFTTN